MKEPWQIFADEYWRSRKKKGHEIAIVDGIGSVAFAMMEQGRNDYNPVIARFEEIADKWDQDGADDFDGLRKSLRHAWTDHELKR